MGNTICFTPAGPWERLDHPIVDITNDKKSFDSLCVTNPAACMRPDGGVVLIYKAVQHIEGKEMGGNVRYGVALAKTPEGPYIKTPGHIFVPERSGKHWMVAEDPFIENDEPTYLFGITDGYLKGGKISTNVQIPLVP